MFVTAIPIATTIMGPFCLFRTYHAPALIPDLGLSSPALLACQHAGRQQFGIAQSSRS